MAKKPIIIAVSSDHHIGSTVGLINPKTPLDDGGDYLASPGQRWLWRNWLEFCKSAVDTADAWKGDLITVFNGDLIETDHKLRSDQIITRNKAKLTQMVYEVIQPLVDYSEQVYIVRGTEAHTGNSSEYEEMIGADLTNAVPENKKKKRYSWDQLELDVHGTRFDIAHHGKMGQMPHTKINGLMSLGMILILDYVESGQWPPTIAIRGHLHRIGDTGDNYKSIRMMALPAWQMATGFVHRVVKGRKKADIGGFIFVCFPDGTYQVEKFRRAPPIRRPLKVKI